MYAFMLCVAAAAVGIDYGWERRTEGGVEYIIQLDPQTLDAMRAGEPIGSDIRPEAGEVRSFRIVVGAKPLPRETPPKTTAPKTPDRKESQPTAPHALPPDPGGKPLSERPAIFVEPQDTAAAGKPQPNPAPEAQSEKPATPWLPLTFTLFGLFASLGANVYLGWIVRDCRQRLVLRNAVS